MAAINSVPCSAQRRAQAIVAQLAPATDESTALSACDTASSSAALTGPASSVQYGGLLAAQACLEQGVRFVFTLTGGHIAPILVGCEAVGIRVVDVRDEATTVFAADAISRLTGVPGVAIVTAGPGSRIRGTPLAAELRAPPSLLLTHSGSLSVYCAVLTQASPTL